MNSQRLILILVFAFVALGAIWLLGKRSHFAEAPVTELSVAEENVKSATPVTALSLAASSGETTDVERDEAAGAEAISSIIAAPDVSEKVAVQKLLELLPQLDPANQAEAAEHIANLSSDEDAVQWSRRVVAWDLPESAGEVLYQTLHNRSNEINFPVLAAIADRKDHPKNEETLETLSVISDPPPTGTSWSQWLQTKLREEAAESAP